MSAKKPRFKYVGTNFRKVDGVALVTGRAKFTDDVDLPGMLHVKVLRSPHAHARIVRIDTSRAEALPGVHAVVCWRDFKRIPYTSAGQGYPEPSPYDQVLFDRKMRFVGDRVAAVAAETPEIAQKALDLIEVEYEVLEAVLDPRKAVDCGVVIHDEEDSTGIYDASRNIAAYVEAVLGDVEVGLAEADVVVENEFSLPYVQQAPIEPHVTVCWLDENDRLVIRTSTQVPHHVRRIVARALDLPVRRIRVIKPRVGGAFGVKQEILLEDVCAALALRTGRPVKWEMTREEEFNFSRSRHPMIIRMRTGAKRDGTLTANEMVIIANTGAYGSHALTVPCNAGSKSLPMYKCPNVRFETTAVYTNLPPAGAFRGYGAPQGIYALECQMDELAAALGMDPLELRARNHIRQGDPHSLAEILGEGREGYPQSFKSCRLDEMVERGRELIGWSTKRGASPLSATAPSPRRLPPRVRGVGCSLAMQGSGIPGIDMAAAFLKMNEDGSFNLLVGATDLGTGSDTILAQIAAETIGCHPENIVVTSSDTDITPFDDGAYASSTTYISGGAVRKAAEDIRNGILRVAAKMLKADPAALIIEDSVVRSPDGNSVTFSEVALHSLYVDEQEQLMGRASHMSYECPPPFAAMFCELEVDTRTGWVEILDFVALADCGVAVNPRLAEGQVEGGVHAGLGYALCEQMLFDSKGRMLNADFLDYKLITARDWPPYRTILVETYEPTGPFGAKSISELPTDGPAPAVANALADALGFRLYDPPFTPEKILKAIEEHYGPQPLADGE